MRLHRGVLTYNALTDTIECWGVTQDSTDGTYIIRYVPLEQASPPAPAEPTSTEPGSDEVG
jgi:hypothetical protein